VNAILLDTHAFVWALKDDARLSRTASRAIAEAAEVFVSPVSFYEIAQKVRLGKWPDMERYIDTLEDEMRIQGSQPVAFTPAHALLAGRLDWAHRDPFDRMLAATALAEGFAFVSADPVFDGARLGRVW
jgi:PIN domain nuclease of toxin-antitoxin system